jgi:hypothetical protein
MPLYPLIFQNCDATPGIKLVERQLDLLDRLEECFRHERLSSIRSRQGSSKATSGTSQNQGLVYAWIQRESSRLLRQARSRKADLDQGPLETRANSLFVSKCALLHAVMLGLPIAVQALLAEKWYFVKSDHQCDMTNFDHDEIGDALDRV